MECRASVDIRTITGMYWKKLIVAYSKNYPGISVKRLTEITINLSNCVCFRRDNYHLEILRVDKRIILKRIVKKYGGSVSTVIKFWVS